MSEENKEPEKAAAEKAAAEKKAKLAEDRRKSAPIPLTKRQRVEAIIIRKLGNTAEAHQLVSDVLSAASVDA